MLNLLTSKEYTLRDCISFLQGQFFSMKNLQEEMIEMNLMESIDQVNLPIHFIMGKHDLTIPYEPTEKFFNEIEAPEKHWTMFENSAHSPMWEEPERFMRILLSETQKDCICK
ncbi:alpha/beta fold hydrolase [Bacillus sp. FSL K6-3431]|uniref:alpha/beta fold hydrolase n=1 Tax=Bacillus sp. FSL K6-3431 TaxID=2921500 RepID=UPI0030FC4335